MAYRRIALFLVHGMGEPLPFETTDYFAVGLTDAYALTEGECMDVGQQDHQPDLEDSERNRIKLTHHLIHDDADETKPVSFVRLDVTNGSSMVARVDLHEAYWAQRPQGLFRLRALLKWMLIQAFAPLRRWAEQGTILPQIGGFRRFLREVAFAFLLPLLVLVFAVIALWIPAAAWTQVTDVAGAIDLDKVADNRLFVVLGAVGLVVAAVGVIIGVGALRLGSLLNRERHYTADARAKHPNRDRDRDLDPDGRINGIASWRTWSLLALILVPLGVFLAILADLNWSQVWQQLDPGNRDWWLLGYLAIAALGVLLAKFLVDFLGDVAVYADGIDGKSRFAAVHDDILQDVVRRLEQLLGSGDYQEVYVAAHSLGSVVAYDAINHLISKERARVAGGNPDPNFTKLQGFLSFRSPLDKFYYFFRKRDLGNPVRAQLISSLTPLRKAKSHRRYGIAEFELYKLSPMPEFRWWSAWAGADILGAHLDFYKPDRQCRFRYGLNPLKAHTGYWDDRKFYCLVRAWLDNDTSLTPEKVTCES